MSAMLTARWLASGAVAGATNTIGSSSSGRTSSGPVSCWPISMKVTSTSPVSTARIRSAESRGLAQHDLDAGPLRPEGAEEAGEDLGADARQRSDSQLALFARGQRPQVGGGGTDSGEDGPGVAQQHLPGRREPHRAAAAGALEQRRADDAFEGADLLADRRLGVAELFGGRAEGARLGHGHQGQEVPQLQAGPRGPTVELVAFMMDTNHSLDCAYGSRCS